MKDILDLQMLLNRRNFFGHSGLRMGPLAAGLLASNSGLPKLIADPSKVTERIHPPLPGLPHFAPRAKSIIYLHMNGAPSQIDTWDYKPGLQDYYDKDLPPSVQGGQRLSTMTSGQSRFPVAPSKFKYEQKGKCGMWTNVDLVPYTSEAVDEIVGLVAEG
jgi:hypothetical protein